MKLKAGKPPRGKKSVRNGKSTVEQYDNGVPCKHDDCSNKFRTLPCRNCGRVQCKGTVIIQDRTGTVYLERLTSYSIKQFNLLSPAEQEQSVLEIYRPPKNPD